MKGGQWCKGFTLLEVLVALVFLSIALVAALKTNSMTMRNSIALKERTLAHWVVLNRAATLELEENWVPLGVSRGEAMMARHVWYWSVQVTKTPDPDIRQAEIAARLHADGSPLTSMVVYLERP